MYLPTTKEGMDIAIGQYIHTIVAGKIADEEARYAAKIAAPGYVEEKFVWGTKTAPKPKKTDAEALADFCDMVRRRKNDRVHR